MTPGLSAWASLQAMRVVAIDLLVRVRDGARRGGMIIVVFGRAR